LKEFHAVTVKTIPNSVYKHFKMSIYTYILRSAILNNYKCAKYLRRVT